MSWVLLLWIISPGGIDRLPVQSFPDRRSCEEAALEINRGVAGGSVKVRWRCLPMEETWQP